MSEATYKAGQLIPGTVYRVVRHLATGGMGTVYDVEDTSVGRRYVLKTLHADYFDRKDLAKRMESEARTLGRLTHPNIVEVVTAGATQDGLRLPYYVMERLNGQNLRTILEKKGALELPHAYRIAIDILDALDHAHEHQVIHRDVKPENIFLHRNRTGTTTTKLLDFGIVRLLGDAEEAKGVFIGTLRYAAPEQLLGQPITPSSDLYAVGLVLFEMIVGRSPFEEIHERKALADAHIAKAPPRLGDLVDVAPDVEELVMSSLAKDPTKRPKDAFAFSARLRDFMRTKERDAVTHTAANVLADSEASQPSLDRAGTGSGTLVNLAGGSPAASADPTGIDPPDSFGKAMGIDRRAETDTSAGPLPIASRHFGTERIVDVSQISSAENVVEAASAGHSTTGSASMAMRETGEGQRRTSRTLVASLLLAALLGVTVVAVSLVSAQGKSKQAPPLAAVEAPPSPVPSPPVPSPEVPAAATSLPTSAPPITSASAREIPRKPASSVGPPPPAPRKVKSGPKLPGPGF